MCFKEYMDYRFNVFFSSFFCQFRELKYKGVSERGGENANILTFLETHYVVRLINTIVALGIALLFGPPDLRTDAIGTHLVENVIGIARSASFDQWRSRILASFAYAELRIILARNLGLELYISKRINQGGCKIHENDETMISNLIGGILIKYLIYSCLFQFLALSKAIPKRLNYY